MRQSTLRRQGHFESVFVKPKNPASSSFKSQKTRKYRDVVGPFEEHTRGIGRRLMERQGWKEGCGLGHSQTGIVKPVESEGQKPKERKGLGYYGEQLPRFGASGSQRGRICKQRIASEDRVIISTIFDKSGESDPGESLLQRNPTTSMKYRPTSSH
jgi:G-patch domain